MNIQVLWKLRNTAYIWSIIVINFSELCSQLTIHRKLQIGVSNEYITMDRTDYNLT